MSGGSLSPAGLGLEGASCGHYQVSILAKSQANNSWAFFPAFLRAPGRVRVRLSWGSPGTLQHSGDS